MRARDPRLHVFADGKKCQPARKTDLGVLRVRGAVGAQEEPRVAAGDRGGDRPPVLLPLQDGQTKRVRPQPALRQTLCLRSPVQCWG